METKIRFSLIVVLLHLLWGPVCRAQDHLAIKTNLLYGVGTLTPNLSLETALGGRTTLELTGSYNGWNLNGSADDNKKLAHWLIRPEVRWWTCERFAGHFLGIHPFYGRYNISGHKIPLLLESGSRDYRYKGYIAGAGLSYGYNFILSRSFNLELTLGAGYGYMKYNKMECDRCSDSQGRFRRNYYGPTRAGITLVYLIK